MGTHPFTVVVALVMVKVVVVATPTTGNIASCAESCRFRRPPRNGVLPTPVRSQNSGKLHTQVPVLLQIAPINLHCELVLHGSPTFSATGAHA